MAAGNSIANRHGHARRGKKTKTYFCWRSMMSRCYRSTDTVYKRYGGAGISVCERWHDFRNFLSDMGEAPDGFSIDRYPDQKGNYEPSNCRWATQTDQVRNRSNTVSITFNGVTKSLGEWAEITGINYKCLAARYYRGYSPERILTMPKMTIAEISKLGNDAHWNRLQDHSKRE